MTKLLVAVKSCLRDAKEGYNQAIRDTWGKHFGDVPVRFFIGNSWLAECDEPVYLKDDEISLNCLDDYDSLPYKTKAICKYVFPFYDHIFLCDTDTFVIPDKLLTCGFEKYDYAGRFGHMPALGTTFTYQNDGRNNRVEDCHPWASGGVGYSLSSRAAKLVSQTEPMSWAEDLFVGQCIGPKIQSGEMIGWDIPEFECQTAWHFPRRMHGNKVYHPSFKWLEKMYQEHIK